MTPKELRIAVIIPSVGRPDCLRQVTQGLSRQTVAPDRVLYVLTKPEDIDFEPAKVLGPGILAEVIMAPKGLPKQRNAGLDRVGSSCEIALFYDDDFYPSRYALEGLRAAFAAWPDVSGMTGHVIADGIGNAGFGEEETVKLVDAWDAGRSRPAARSPTILADGLVGLYGCNMAFRVSAIGATRFDEALPLYGWQEDIDFSARISGRLIRTDAFAGVHRGSKGVRETSGHRLGYSQMVNPYYLWKKGTLPARLARRLVVRNFVANHLRQLRPEPWIDRRGRMLGNWHGIVDILAGRSHPGRIHDFKN